jgi:hypothetical protein
MDPYKAIREDAVMAPRAWEGGFIMADKSKGVDGKKKRKKKPPELKETKHR